MTLDLSHLATAAKEQIFQDAKARIQIVQTARWVGFSRAQVAVEELERRYNYPPCARMPCLLLYGDSGMGKTMILEKMERQHPSSHDERRGISPSVRLAVGRRLLEECVEVLALCGCQGTLDDVAQRLLTLIHGRDDQIGQQVVGWDLDLFAGEHIDGFEENRSWPHLHGHQA